MLLEMSLTLLVIAFGLLYMRLCVEAWNFIENLKWARATNVATMCILMAGGLAALHWIFGMLNNIFPQ